MRFSSRQEVALENWASSFSSFLKCLALVIAFDNPIESGTQLQACACAKQAGDFGCCQSSPAQSWITTGNAVLRVTQKQLNTKRVESHLPNEHNVGCQNPTCKIRPPCGLLPVIHSRLPSPGTDILHLPRSDWSNTALQPPLPHDLQERLLCGYAGHTAARSLVQRIGEETWIWGSLIRVARLPSESYAADEMTRLARR